jgi:hypothetical protein
MRKLNATFFLKTSARVQSLLLVCALSVSFLGTLTSCGGSTNPVDSVNPPTSHLELNKLTSPGVFSVPWNDKEFTSILIKTSMVQAEAGHFYALQFNNPDPDIYSGSLSGLGTGTATSYNLVHQNTSGTLRSGTATAFAVSATGVKTTLNFPATPTESFKELSWTANVLPDTTYQFNTPALLSIPQGSWTGRLSYGFGFSEKYTLTVLPNGDLIASQVFQSDCQISKARLLPHPNGVNIFTFSAHIPTATQCFLKNEALNGVAFVSASTEPGKTQRIQWVATTRDGRGFSFRADR